MLPNVCLVILPSKPGMRTTIEERVLFSEIFSRVRGTIRVWRKLYFRLLSNYRSVPDSGALWHNDNAVTDIIGAIFAVSIFYAIAI